MKADPNYLYPITQTTLSPLKTATFMAKVHAGIWSKGKNK